MTVAAAVHLDGGPREGGKAAKGREGWGWAEEGSLIGSPSSWGACSPAGKGHGRRRE